MNNKDYTSQDELLDTFSRFSHDIKNIISTMYANYQLAEMKDPTLKDSAYWSRFKTSIRNLNEYVDRVSILRYSYRCNQTSFDLCDLLYSLPDLCDEQLPDYDRNITFEFNVDSCTITADYDTLSYALTEILVNAYEATTESDNIHIVLNVTEGNATISIINNGEITISPDTIFQPYTTTKANHLGIGLAIASNVACTHNGTIKVESAQNSTSLHLTLPL